MKFHCPECKGTINFKSLVPYQKTVARGKCRKCSHKCERTCPRCNTTIQYVHHESLKKNTGNDCKACRHIPDSMLEAFKQGRYVKECPRCHGEQEYKTRPNFLNALAADRICRSCASTENAPIVTAKVQAFWASMSKKERARRSKVFSESAKRTWEALSPEEKQRRSEEKSRQQIEYFANLTQEEMDAWKAKLKESFKKWRGKNHWMNRPETMAKIHTSYMKYLGKNHWRHRPGIHEKILATQKFNRELKDIGVEM